MGALWTNAIGNASRAAYLAWMRDHGGQILNISATLHHGGTPGQLHVAAAKAIPTGSEFHAPSEGQSAGGCELVKDDRTIPHRRTYDEVTGLVQRFEQPIQRASLHQPHTARLNSVVHGAYSPR